MRFPVESVIDEIKRHLADNSSVVLTAPPGSGKTTCVASSLMDEPWLKGRKIIMLEPRRLAARNCARYIASKLGQNVGDMVGYHVRLERKVSSRTRLEIVTEGLLSQRLLSDPELSDTALIIFDEFHERSLSCDTSFALALESRRALRDDLRLLVMSATLDADEVASHLGDAEIVRAQGRMFPVETKYLGDVPISSAVKKALAETDGDVLCFLPGEREIKSSQEALIGIDAEVLPLYGALPKEEQDRVFAPSQRRKVILSTSIAETSVTIEGVTAVVDSGLMRVSKFSPASAMSSLVTLPLTKDRAEQRRGRAGRVSAGICYRLWNESDDASRPSKMSPEILDADLASTVMISASWGALRRDDLPWLTVPPASSWDRARNLLKLLGAIDDDGRLCEHGEKMAKLPMHPRLANMMLKGGDASLAAILEEGVRSREVDIRYVKRTPRMRELSRRFSAYELPGRGLSQGSMLALAYPERIARNRGNGTFRMVSGRGAFFEDGEALAKEPYVVCCELDAREQDAKVFLAAPISEKEIFDLFADRMVERRVCLWDRRTDGVKCTLAKYLGEMPLCEKQVKPDDIEAVSCILEGVRLKGVENMPCWSDGAVAMKARINFLHKHFPDTWPEVSDEKILAALKNFVSGMTRWRDLERIDLTLVMDLILADSGHDRRELDSLAPKRMDVPSGSSVKVSYEGQEPTVQVRLQECFGLMQTPKVALGTVPIVMTLLSPAARPIQVTKDLEGFWRGAYQLVRKDMRGRYPKHYWPEDPFTAVATKRVRPTT